MASHRACCIYYLTENIITDSHGGVDLTGARQSKHPRLNVVAITDQTLLAPQECN